MPPKRASSPAAKKRPAPLSIQALSPRSAALANKSGLPEAILAASPRPASPSGSGWKLPLLPATWIVVWFIISSLVVLWDAAFVLLRPASLPGGSSYGAPPACLPAWRLARTAAPTASARPPLSLSLSRARAVPPRRRRFLRPTPPLSLSPAAWIWTPYHTHYMPVDGQYGVAGWKAQQAGVDVWNVTQSRCNLFEVALAALFLLLTN
jgi:hypothetical protein